LVRGCDCAAKCKRELELKKKKRRGKDIGSLSCLRVKRNREIWTAFMWIYKPAGEKSQTR